MGKGRFNGNETRERLMKLFDLQQRKHETVIIYVAGAVLGLILIFGVAFQAWPQLGDMAKPSLRLEGLAEGGRYTGALSVTFSVEEQATGVGRVHLELDGTAIYDKAINEKRYYDGTVIETTKLQEGPHQFYISVTAVSLWRQSEARSIAFFIDRTPPHVTASPVKEFVYQGDTLGFFVHADESLRSLVLETLGKTVSCYELADKVDTFRGLVAVNLFTQPGTYAVKFTATDLAGNTASSMHQYTVKYRRFLAESIDLPSEKSGILTNMRKINEDYDKVTAALALRAKTQFWSGVFIHPVEGIESSPFGIMRVYSATGSIESYHRGIDLANNEGTPVHAANNGVVILAEELFVYGNTVILDHGQGVITFYCHMSKLEVKKDCGFHGYDRTFHGPAPPLGDADRRFRSESA
jgi:murein DD-endopeptidase MepM/ murein hydrolase activator NlpD